MFKRKSVRKQKEEISLISLIVHSIVVPGIFFDVNVSFKQSKVNQLIHIYSSFLSARTPPRTI